MPRTRRKPTVQARLAPEVFKHFSEIARAKEMTKAALATDAILDYLANYERKKHEEKDRKITEEIDRLSKNYVNATHQMAESQVNATRQMADRVCGMLMRIHRDISVVLELHGELTPDERIDELMKQSVQRVKKELASEEKAVRDKMSKFMTGDDNT